MTYYMAVTNDRLELPLAGGESMSELGQKMGCDRSYISRKLHGCGAGKHAEYRVVCVSLPGRREK